MKIPKTKQIKTLPTKPDPFTSAGTLFVPESKAGSLAEILNGAAASPGIQRHIGQMVAADPFEKMLKKTRAQRPASLTRERRRMGKYSFITIAAFIVTFGLVRANLNQVSQRSTDLFIAHYERAAAKSAAHSLAHMSLTMLSDSTTWRGGYANLPLADATGGSALVDSGTDTTLNPAQVRITAQGHSGGSVDTVVVKAIVPFHPGSVHAAITANSVVTTLGNLDVDGRDHDLNGALIPGQGTLGVSTTQTLNQGGSSQVGGTAGTVDYPPTKPANPAVVEEHATYPFPSSPDEVLGYDAGFLKAMAQSGVNGGQYVTNPAVLSFPLSGVTYVELPDGGLWQSIDFGASSGVLVVHNTWGNAAIKNLNSGTFKGLLIADDIEKIHMTIIGAIVSLTTSPSGNCIGNGTGDVLYSSAAINQASSLSAGGDGGVTVVSWLE